jgi:hypothetical protein
MLMEVVGVQLMRVTMVVELNLVVVMVDVVVEVNRKKRNLATRSDALSNLLSRNFSN